VRQVVRASTVAAVLVAVLLGTAAAVARPKPTPVSANLAPTTLPAPTTTTLPAAVDPRVFIIGDSVILGARDAIAFRLAVHGWSDVQFSAESFHTFNAGPVIDAAQAMGKIGDVVIVALGSNDGIDPNEFHAWIDGVMQHLQSVRRVYWVNLRQFRDWVTAANAEIDAAKLRYPNMRIIDWWARSTFDPGLVADDGLHLNDSGQAAMGDLITTTLEAYRTERAAAASRTPSVPTTLPVTSTLPASGPSHAQAGPAHPSASDDGTPLALWIAAGAAALTVIGAASVALARKFSQPDPMA
jgi:hypothetical protein